MIVFQDENKVCTLSILVFEQRNIIKLEHEIVMLVLSEGNIIDPGCLFSCP